MTVLSLEARMPADVPIMVCAVESFEPVALARCDSHPAACMCVL